MNNKDIYQKKLSLIQKTISDDKNSSLFKYYDNLLISRRFEVAEELAYTEQILTLDSYNLNTKEIIKTMHFFIDNPNIKKANIFDIIKISNLICNKLINNIPKNLLSELGNKLESVSRETTLIGVDFSILRALDNFIIKIKDLYIVKKYKNIKKTILIKILSFDYDAQDNELESVYFCWIDRILTSVLQHEFNVNDFIKLIKKLLKIIPEKLDVYWKILQVINYLIFQPEFDDSKELRKFKRYILKLIKEIFDFQKINQTDVKRILINTLAEPSLNKEKYYYLFNLIRKMSEKSSDDKYFCFDIIDYLIYIDKKQNIFCNRFIREAFISTVFAIMEKEDILNLKEKEICIMLKLFHINLFFIYNKKDLLNQINILLCDINKNMTGSKFYKYFDMADYIFAKNKDIIGKDFIEKISESGDNFKRIYNRFSLYLA